MTEISDGLKNSSPSYSDSQVWRLEKPDKTWGDENV